MSSAAHDMQNVYDPWDAACVDLTDISARPPRELAMLASKLLFRVLASSLFAPQTKEAPFFNSGLFPICLDQT